MVSLESTLSIEASQIEPIPPFIKTNSGKVIPSNVLYMIINDLPMSTLATIASASKTFKAIIYHDTIWNEKLKQMMANDHGALVTKLGNKVSHSGIAREQFKQLYIQLLPYYIDLRYQTKEETKIWRELHDSPEECGKIINLLTSLGQCQIVDDWREINEDLDALSRYFESISLHQFQVAYDDFDIPQMKIFADALIALNGGSTCIQTYVQRHPLFKERLFKPEDNFVISQDDLTPFKNYMIHISEQFEKQSSIALNVFPKELDAFYIFVDRLFEDVITEYIGQLLSRAISFNIQLYLRTMSVVLSKTKKLVDTLTTNNELPKKIEADRGVNLLFKLFLPFLDDYLLEESNYAEAITKKYIDDWSNRSAVKLNHSTRLTNQSRETFKRDYLAAFKKVITLPVDLVSTAATTIVSPFQRLNGGSIPNFKRFNFEIPSTTPSSRQITPPETPINRSASTPSLHNEDKEATGQLEFARQELDMLQNYLSLETALQLIHINKESERRIQQFIDIGFPGRMKADIHKTYEQIFIHFLKRLGTTHIQPGFSSATERLASYKPSMSGSLEDVPPLTEFFELVHIADVIQQMIQLYYDEEITKNVDKHDFLNDMNKEKKVFERLLDDCVAQGLDRGIQVLLSQVEFILASEQLKEDYNPIDDMPDVKPTKACQDSIQCLKTNMEMLTGAAEKSTMNLFFSEIGRRYFEVLCKHLKLQTVNEVGALKYICDMNAYYDFCLTLRQKSVTPYFLVLKELANLYIIDSPTDIKLLIHDLERYHGLLRIEDMFEFAACRSDWSTVKKVVQKDMTDCNMM